jgi:hypothetical protein
MYRENNLYFAPRNQSGGCIVRTRVTKERFSINFEGAINGFMTLQKGESLSPGTTDGKRDLLLCFGANYSP